MQWGIRAGETNSPSTVRKQWTPTECGVWQRRHFSSFLVVHRNKNLKGRVDVFTSFSLFDCEYLYILHTSRFFSVFAVQATVGVNPLLLGSGHQTEDWLPGDNLNLAHTRIFRTWPDITRLVLVNMTLWIWNSPRDLKLHIFSVMSSLLVHDFSLDWNISILREVGLDNTTITIIIAI